MRKLISDYRFDKISNSKVLAFDGDLPPKENKKWYVAILVLLTEIAICLGVVVAGALITALINKFAFFSNYELGPRFSFCVSILLVLILKKKITSDVDLKLSGAKTLVNALICDGHDLKNLNFAETVKNSWLMIRGNISNPMNFTWIATALYVSTPRAIGEDKSWTVIFLVFFVSMVLFRSLKTLDRKCSVYIRNLVGVLFIPTLYCISRPSIDDLEELVNRYNFSVF